MSDVEEKSTITKSGSIESLDTQPIDETTIVTSIRISEDDMQTFMYKEGRKAMLPSQYKPNDIPNFSENFTETDKIYTDRNKNIENIENIQTHTKTYQSTRNEFISRQPQISTENDIGKSIRNDKEMNDDNLDVFILKNFAPFDGKSDVIQWLDETEEKFNHFRIGRHLRYQSISLLFKGDAKQLYLSHRKNIDDFYELLLSSFRSNSNHSDTVSSCHRDNTLRNTKCDTCSTQLVHEEKVCRSNTSSKFYSGNQSNVLPMNSNLGATNVNGEAPVATQSMFSFNSSTTQLGPVLSDLRKATKFTSTNGAVVDLLKQNGVKEHANLCVTSLMDIIFKSEELTAIETKDMVSDDRYEAVRSKFRLCPEELNHIWEWLHNAILAKRRTIIGKERKAAMNNQ
ncbi:unnamed protein product [Adineta ricciae]|uniref:Uncharacterized protein n=1 Tax=Adineta ricciae TaxID=249248 RepID=A0A816D065_ADIRI|nr:unnamed protein product [Adineta ricciae]CAF1628361.1 unnamed protein product [Adineta ricciae]